MQTLFPLKKLVVLEYVLPPSCFYRRYVFILPCQHSFYFVFINKVTVVKNEEGGNSVATVVLRGSTDSILDDLERAVDDGVNTYKVYVWYLIVDVT